ncbi:tRNA preQ1(34) S-adenosylmethionine ribosyltransferase-isomerase QueA [Cylindrospermum sp. FACHB-282]|uniref:tRNA preQ1(34) S-adenosylmethionine ribosyltransferase-isomerase QueA n=1 Tax=Cylindrospermum sp. FACHB-282 TaxID=2692794 RepID=UPI0016857202|nr:tRNA preQ1(34) S-adenosylmethionine ribosyltransferase-isomerase QueA [Cylindrospermum sp. FACHB-282]MBD2387471.1 tRNA preQ1(34) S-adenosylmethionine ribosyltransferase-isomerase QueA [Cylindrospermum sp. FACHB-282]
MIKYPQKNLPLVESNPVQEDILLSSYNYHLPPELIAKTPVMPRDSSRLLVVNSPTTHRHSIFQDLPRWLSPGDLLIFNNTRVIPARLDGKQSTGNSVKVFLLEEKIPGYWLALVESEKQLNIGSEIWFGTTDKDPIEKIPLLQATVIDTNEGKDTQLLKFEVSTPEVLWQKIEQLGTVTLPPFIQESQANPSQYQTIYAQQPGSVAAPTAGLHFTQELLEELSKQGINQAHITLQISSGTFHPVEVEEITKHNIHQEWIDVSETTIKQIRDTQAEGGRIIAVGTTVVRALEGSAKVAEQLGQNLTAFRGKTDIFIYPGYRWRVIDGMITNFHLPRSSLLMLVSALIGRDRLLELYREAISSQYRFYSFGDSMLILPECR